MSALGLHVIRHREGQFSALTAPLMFIEPRLDEFRVGSQEHELHPALAARVGRGLTTIVVLPKWIPDTSSRGAASVTPVSRAEVRDLLSVLWSELDSEFAYYPGKPPVTVRHRLPRDQVHEATFAGALGSFAVRAPWLQTFRVRGSDGGVKVLLGTKDEALIVERYLEGRGRLLVVSDPDLLSSYNLHRADHANLWVTLLAEEMATDTVVIDEVLHGFGQQLSLGSALGRFPLVLVPLHALLLVLLVIAAGAVRFGPPRRVAPALGRGPQEVIGVAASVFAAGRPAPQLAAGYVRRVLADVALGVGIAQGRGQLLPGLGAEERAALPEAEQHGLLDDLAERKGQPRQAHTLAREADVFDAVTAGHEKDALRLAQRAWAFRVALLAQQKREK
jgi:hypothetical protein